MFFNNTETCSFSNLICILTKPFNYLQAISVLFVCLFVCLLVWFLFVCLFVCLFVYLFGFFCLFVCFFFNDYELRVKCQSSGFFIFIWNSKDKRYLLKHKKYAHRNKQRHDRYSTEGKGHFVHYLRMNLRNLQIGMIKKTRNMMLITYLRTYGIDG